MKELIKVEQVTSRTGISLPNETLGNTLSAIFGDGVKEQEWQGVRFIAITSSGYRDVRLIGIGLQTGRYANTTRRRVMVKNGQIDKGAVIAKFAELKAIAADEADLEGR